MSAATVSSESPSQAMHQETAPAVVSRPSTNNRDQFLWARQWEFADAHSSTHQFLENALQARAPKEIGCAFAASFLVSPLVSIIDKCIVKDVGTPAQLMGRMGGALKDMILAPRQFLASKPFVLTFGVYFGTYTVANLSELALDSQKVRDDEERKEVKVMAASVANVSLLSIRDAIFARDAAAASGAKVVPSPPLRTYGLFTVRDSSTMFSTFYLAPRAAEFLVNEHQVERNTAELSMALLIPMVTQIITAPVHIYALDYYNRPNANTWPERMATIREEFNAVSLARGLRILPAFGIGSFSNNKFREWMIPNQKAGGDPSGAQRLQRRITSMMTRHAEQRKSAEN